MLCMLYSARMQVPAGRIPGNANSRAPATRISNSSGPVWCIAACWWDRFPAEPQLRAVWTIHNSTIYSTSISTYSELRPALGTGDGKANLTLSRPQRLHDLGRDVHAAVAVDLYCCTWGLRGHSQEVRSQVGLLCSPAAEASSGVTGMAGGRRTHYPLGRPAPSSGTRAGRAEGQAQPQHSACDLSRRRVVGLLPWGHRVPSASVPVSTAQAGWPA